MREIKFRVWNKSIQKMYDVRCIDFENQALDVITENWCELMKFKDCELMQYTWLKDKNWKEIYEGDIVVWLHKNIEKIKPDPVKFHFGNFVVDSFNYLPLDEFLTSYWTNLEIIGNIYENPELLTN